MGDFLWINPAEPVNKLSEAKLKKCFFYGQPKALARTIQKGSKCPLTRGHAA